LSLKKKNYAISKSWRSQKRLFLLSANVIEYYTYSTFTVI